MLLISIERATKIMTDKEERKEAEVINRVSVAFLFPVPGRPEDVPSL